MKRKTIWLTINIIALMCLSGGPVDAEVVFSDKNGVTVEYRIIDTGKYTHCADKNDPDYTSKKIKIWKATVILTNNSTGRIKPQGRTVATINVGEDIRGGPYCFYYNVPNFHSIGYPDQGGLPLGIMLGMVYPINPGKSISESEYLYLYEDRKPIMTSWFFSGYYLLKDKTKKSKNQQQSDEQASKQSTAANANQRTTPSGKSSPTAKVKKPTSPSGSLILLIDVSGSMKGAKLDSAKQAAIETIRKAVRNKSEVAILAFEGDCGNPVERYIDFTGNENQLVAFIDGLSAQGGTPLATALDVSNRFMKQRKSAASKTQMILLLADGDDDCGGLDEVLGELKRNNLLYRHETVGLEVSDEARKQLRNIATQSGGNYHGATSENLSQVFSDAVELMRMLDMIGKFK